MDQRAMIGMRVGQDFLLHDNGAFVFMHELDRVFNSDDLAAPHSVPNRMANY
jgi:hypothetical protein